MNEWGVVSNCERDAAAYHIIKPIGTLHEMLAMMGDQLLRTEGLRPGGASGCFAARSGDTIDVMLYRCDENDLEGEGPDEDFILEFDGLGEGKYTADLYIMDREHHNTFRLWQRMGCKKTLTQEEEALLHREEEIRVTQSLPLPDDHRLRLSLPAQSLVLAKIRK